MRHLQPVHTPKPHTPSYRTHTPPFKQVDTEKAEEVAASLDTIYNLPCPHSPPTHTPSPNRWTPRRRRRWRRRTASTTYPRSSSSGAGSRWRGGRGTWRRSTSGSGSIKCCHLRSEALDWRGAAAARGAVRACGSACASGSTGCCCPRSEALGLLIERRRGGTRQPGNVRPLGASAPLDTRCQPGDSSAASGPHLCVVAFLTECEISVSFERRARARESLPTWDLIPAVPPCVLLCFPCGSHARRHSFANVCSTAVGLPSTVESFDCCLPLCPLCPGAVAGDPRCWCWAPEGGCGFD